MGTNNLLEKFQKVGARLRSWNRRKVGNIPRKIHILQEELQNLQFDDHRVHIQDQRRSIMKELTKYTKYEEELWVQRSRVNWMQAGDSNTKFFHNFAKSRGWRNKVRGIHDQNGCWQEDVEGIQRAFVDFF